MTVKVTNVPPYQIMHTNLGTVCAPPALVDGADYTLCYEQAEELFGGETSYENHGNYEDLKKKKKNKQDYVDAMYVPVLCIMTTNNVVPTVVVHLL